MTITKTIKNSNITKALIILPDRSPYKKAYVYFMKFDAVEYSY